MDNHFCIAELTLGPFVLGHPWMLCAAAAAAIPLIIHLLNRRKASETPWAAMALLLAAIQQNARRIHFQQILLLAIRTLVLLLLAVALADVSCRSPNTAAGDSPLRGPLHTVIVLDGSYSMDFRDKEKTRWERAKELAGELVANARGGDAFSLVLLSEHPTAIISNPSFDHDTVAAEIESLQLPHGGANLAAAIAEIDELLTAAGRSRGRFDSQRVWLFTDLDRRAWGAAAEGQLAEPLAALSRQAKLYLYDLGGPAADNVAVVDVQADRGFLIARQEVQFTVRLKNFGLDSSEVPVSLLVDGEPVGERRVLLRPGGQQSVTFTHRFRTAGEHTVEVRAVGDRLTIDDRRWLSAPVRESVRVLCIRGKSGAERFVARALDPGEDGTAGVQVTTAPESALWQQKLDAFDCVVLCNVADFRIETADALRRFVDRGGALVVLLGDQVSAEAYNRRLGPRADGRSLLPARLGEASPIADYSVDPRKYAHPIVRPFEGSEDTGLLSTPVWKYIRLRPISASDQQPAAEVALALAGGDPLIVTGDFGRGRVVLVATAASTESTAGSGARRRPWTLLPKWPSFPPLAHEMVRFAVGTQLEERNTLVGRPLTGYLSAPGGEADVIVIDPTGARFAAEVVSGEAARQWLFNETSLSGVYRVEIDRGRPQRYAVGVDTRESALERIDPQLLPPEFVRRAALVEETAAPEASTQYAGGLYGYFLAVVLLLMSVEVLLAWRFGSGQRT